MRKILFTLFVIILMSVNVFAQYKSFQFGLKVEPGVNCAILDSDNLYDGKTKMSFNWGFVGNFYFVENYGISTGFNVRYINSEYSYNNNINEFDRIIKNQYLEIPVSLIMRTEAINNLRILGNIGYGAGILLNDNTEDFDVHDNKTSVDRNEFATIRHAFILKLGIEYDIYKSSCLTAAIVYNNNFMNIYDKNISHDVMLNSICIEIGFLF